MSNGTVTATGGTGAGPVPQGGAGIGGGASSSSSGTGAQVQISGGTVTAVGGESTSAPEIMNGVGIGSGATTESGISGEAGTLRVNGIKVEGSQIDGGAGGTSTQAPHIQFLTTGTRRATVVPVTNVPDGVGSARITLSTVPAPTPPPVPVKKKQQPAKWIPKKLKNRGTVLLNRANAKTRQGRPQSARASVRLMRGEITCFRVIRGKNRKLAIKTTGLCKLQIRVTYTAPGSASYLPLKMTKTYKTKRIR